jgi:hypothetical protein
MTQTMLLTSSGPFPPYVIIIKKYESKKNHVPMAQTTPDTSFGPVFNITAYQLSLHRVSCRLRAIYTINTS